MREEISDHGMSSTGQVSLFNLMLSTLQAKFAWVHELHFTVWQVLTSAFLVQPREGSEVTCLCVCVCV